MTKASPSAATVDEVWIERVEAIRAFGEEFGSRYRNIWDDTTAMAASISAAVHEPARELAGAAPYDRRREQGWGRTAWISALIFLISLPFARFGEPSLLFPVVAAAVLLHATHRWSVNKDRAKDQYLRMRLAWEEALAREGAKTSWDTVMIRREVARSYDPVERRRTSPFAPGGPAPTPQPFGVSHAGAEALVAEWIKYLGEADAKTTVLTGDGGIDVESRHYIAQVKNYTGSVGVGEVRELAGVAAVDTRKPLFFTSGTYALGAVDFANRSGIALFTYDASMGTLHGANELGEKAVAEGL